MVDVELWSRLPRWSEVQASLANLNGRQIEMRIDQAFRNNRYGEIAEPEQLTALLTTMLSPWYGIGPWQIFNGIFGFSWADRPLAQYAYEWDYFRDDARDRVLTSLTPLIPLLTRLSAVLNTLPGEAQSRRGRNTLGTTLATMLDVLVAVTQARGPWFEFLPSLVLWLCDAVEITRDEALSALTALDLSFQEDVLPTLAERYSVVRALLDSLAPMEAPPSVTVEDRVEHLGAPLRDKLDAAREAVAGRGADEAFESLVSRDLLPADFLDHAQRGFARVDANGRTVTILPSPDRDLLALFAAGYADIDRAERLALELAHRLVSYGLERRITQVVWMRGAAPSANRPSLFAGDHDLFRKLSDAAAVLSGATLDEATFLARFPLYAKTYAPGSDPASVRRQCLDAEADLAQELREATITTYNDLFPRWNAALRWQTLLDGGARIPTEGVAQQLGMNTKVQRMLSLAAEPGTPLSMVPDALGVLIELWSTGYSLHEIDAKRGRVVLLVPPVQKVS